MSLGVRFSHVSSHKLTFIALNSFTGSTRVGSIIAQTCGKHLKPVVLELGGKAPAIVCSDADLQDAATAIMFGGWFHSGQICMATQTASALFSAVQLGAR